MKTEETHDRVSTSYKNGIIVDCYKHGTVDIWGIGWHFRFDSYGPTLIVDSVVPESAKDRDGRHI